MSTHRSCGTDSGYVRHSRLGETACELCRAAHRDYSRRRRIVAKSKKLLDSGINIPALTVARMYLLSPIDVQIELDKIIDADVIDEIVRLHDQYVDITRKAS